MNRLVTGSPGSLPTGRSAQAVRGAHLCGRGCRVQSASALPPASDGGGLSKALLFLLEVHPPLQDAYTQTPLPRVRRMGAGGRSRME